MMNILIVCLLCVLLCLFGVLVIKLSRAILAIDDIVFRVLMDKEYIEQRTRFILDMNKFFENERIRMLESQGRLESCVGKFESLYMRMNKPQPKK